MTEETKEIRSIRTEVKNPSEMGMFGIKSLAEMQQKGFASMYGDKLKEAWTHDWYFKGWEKLLILGCFVWSVWCVGSWLWSIL